MDGMEEDLTKFITSLSTEQLRALSKLLEKWQEGNYLIEIGLEDGAVAISCTRKDVINADAT